MSVLASEVPAYQRSVGEIDLVVAAGQRHSHVRRAFQAGSAKLRVLRTAGSGVEAMVLNTAGGLAGGDRFDLAARVEAGAALTLSTQASERVYRAEGGTPQVRQTLGIAAGGSLVHAPQPTIVFEASALRRQTRIEIEGDGALTFCEGLVLGRAAMGEKVRRLALRDRTDVLLDGTLRFADALRLDDEGLARAGTPAALGGNRAIGLVIHRGADLARALDAVRGTLGEGSGASLVRGLLVVRVLAPTHGALQDTLARILTVLTGAPAPRSWLI